MRNKTEGVYRNQGRHSTFFGRDVWCTALKRGAKELILKVRSKEVKFVNILRACELKFGPNLDCKAVNSEKLLPNFSHSSQNVCFFFINFTVPARTWCNHNIVTHRLQYSWGVWTSPVQCRGFYFLHRVRVVEWSCRKKLHWIPMGM